MSETESPTPAPADPDPVVPSARLDAEGLPLDRAPTIDDVRLRTGEHGRIAIGCALVVVLLIAAFWLVRGGFIG